MTAIVAILSSAHAAQRESGARQMLHVMQRRGSAAVRLHSQSGITLGVACDVWEGTPESLRIARHGDTSAVADAALVYRADLKRALVQTGIVPAGPSCADLVLAAYRAWGAACAERLEGDFAFVVWDGAERCLIAARDFAAKRPLHYSDGRRAFLLASTVEGVLAHPSCGDALDVAHVGEVAAGLTLDDERTCRLAIQRVPAAHTLRRSAPGRVSLACHWSPPRFEQGQRTSFDDGALELRDLLVRSAKERLDARGATSIWLSGGWDSTAVFGAAMHALRDDTRELPLRPVSITYPPGDPGREDPYIQAVTQRWSVAPHWIDIARIPLFDCVQDAAAMRDEPFAHVFEHWNRALARGSRAVGSRIALEGNGGDQLFQVSLVYLADLMSRGRFLTLRKECQARGIRDARTLFRWAVQPSLPTGALNAVATLRQGRRLRSYLERPIASWIRASFARDHALHTRAQHTVAPEVGESHSAAEARWYLTTPYFPRVFACVSGLARDEGIETRSPLYDRRLIEFASTRPREEKALRAETKRLLRAAMRGLLPDEILAPRTGRTGTTGAFFARAMRQDGGALVSEVARDSRLADLGVIDPVALQQGWMRWEQSHDANLGVQLFFTIQTELWLRGARTTWRSQVPWTASVPSSERTLRTTCI